MRRLTGRNDLSLRRETFQLHSFAVAKCKPECSWLALEEKDQIRSIHLKSCKVSCNRIYTFINSKKVLRFCIPAIKASKSKAVSAPQNITKLFLVCSEWTTVTFAQLHMHYDSVRPLAMISLFLGMFVNVSW